jgi:lysophospholipase L1-like esterase
MKKHLFTGVLAVLLTFLSAASADELILRHDRFERNLHTWNVPSYWSGKLELADDGGRKVLKLVGTSGKRGAFGRATAGFSKHELFAGTKVLISVEAKGKGEFLSGMLVYHPGVKRPEYRPGQTVVLTGDFRTYDFEVTIQWRCHNVRPYIEVGDSGEVLIREFRMAAQIDFEVEVAAVGGLTVVKPGEALPEASFRTNRPGAEFSIAQLNLNNHRVREAKVKADADGVVNIPAVDQGRGVWEFSAARSGKSATNYFVKEGSAADFERTDALAKRVKLDKKLHILIIGDSLSDFYRGYNYVDRLEFWLNRYNPGMVTIRNAGVRGDFVKRVQERLLGTEGKAKDVYEQSRYDRLFDEKYDLIFIFLGQNDTRTPKKLNYAVPLTEPHAQYDGLKAILEFIRKRSDAKIVLVSPSPCCAEYIEARRAKAKKNFVMFGKKEFVDNYDLMNRRFCKEFGLDYVDILDPMRNAPDLKALYVKDGVHLSLIGGRFVADELLRYFSK